MTMLSRPRRNRKNASVREMLQETRLHPSQLVYPVFVCEGRDIQQPVSSLPGQFRQSLDVVLKTAQEAWELGIRGLALFPVLPDNKKDPLAKESKNPQGLLPQSIQALKQALPEMMIFSDVAMDPYSSDGHDGVVQNGQILNDETLPILAEMALNQARAGADWVAASDMMDGRIGFLRKTLDENGYVQCSILSYSAKYASAFYGPFREALDSAPRFGDKKTYQMNPANRKEALRERIADEEEGADMLMVKPALSYLDVISDFQNSSTLPIAAYNVSGEYAMVKAAAEKNWIEESQIVNEILTSIRRAGADVIFSYHALDWARSKRI